MPEADELALEKFLVKFRNTCRFVDTILKAIVAFMCLYWAAVLGVMSVSVLGLYGVNFFRCSNVTIVITTALVVLLFCVLKFTVLPQYSFREILWAVA